MRIFLEMIRPLQHLSPPPALPFVSRIFMFWHSEEITQADTVMSVFNFKLINLIVLILKNAKI